MPRKLKDKLEGHAANHPELVKAPARLRLIGVDFAQASEGFRRAARCLGFAYNRQAQITAKLYRDNEENKRRLCPTCGGTGRHDIYMAGELISRVCGNCDGRGCAPKEAP